jgi:hypothetical protein
VQARPQAVTYSENVFDRRRRESVRQVLWVRHRTEARLYLAAVVLAPVAFVGSMVLTAADLPWYLSLPLLLFGVLPPFLYVVNMVEDAAHRRQHPFQGWWALKAQVWLHCGGALGQAWRARSRPSPLGSHQG